MLTKEKSILTYTNELSSTMPAPGGGGASSLSAALGISLLLMVSNLTLGKKKYADFEERLKVIISELEEKKALFLSLCDKDEEAFLPLSKAYKLPKESEAEKAYRKKEIECCLYKAAEVPLIVLRNIKNCCIYAEELSIKGSRLAVSDVAAGAKLLEAGCDTAYLNVIINTASMSDRKKADTYNNEALELRKEINHICSDIYNMICNRLI